MSKAYSLPKSLNYTLEGGVGKRLQHLVIFCVKHLRVFHPLAKLREVGRLLRLRQPEVHVAPFSVLLLQMIVATLPVLGWGELRIMVEAVLDGASDPLAKIST